MMVLDALLVDDEPPARHRLRRLLGAHPEQVRVIGEAASADEADVLLRQRWPDVLFLDVEMPGRSGFDLLAALDRPPHVVFVTAYDQYAVRAFEARALDYLLKPVEPDRLAQTLAVLTERAARAAPPPLTPDVLAALAAALRPPPPPVTTIPVKTGDHVRFVRLDEVTHLEARDKYVFLHTADGREHLLEGTLTALAEKLPPHFVRVHRAIVVNRDRIVRAVHLFKNRYRLYLDAHPPVHVSTGPSFAAAVRALLEL